MKNTRLQTLVSQPIVDPLRYAVQHFCDREREALRVYRPITAAQMRVHEMNARECLVRGGKRSGKSTSCAAEVSSRILGIPVIGPNGEPYPVKYKVSTPEDTRTYWFIGWDIKHIGQTIYRLFFEPGLFRVIKDEETGAWRTYNPALEEDACRYEASFPAEPMIPSRLIDEDSWVWVDRAANVFESVRLKNGAKLFAFPSSAKAPKMGDPVDGLFIDEDIEQPHFLDEYQDRLTDRNGWFMWAVWPQVRNFALTALLDRAEAVKDDPDRDIEAVQLLMSENPMISTDAKNKAFDRMGSADAIARRDRGELLLDAVAMYDYVPVMHRVNKLVNDDETERPPNRMAALRRVLTRNGGKLPWQWTRYLAVDPSHTRTAVLFGVVPPQELDDGFPMGNVMVIEDELILLKSTAQTLAAAVKEKIGDRRYQAFIMDRRIGQQTRVGSDITVFHVYGEAFKKAGVTSRMTKHDFIPGCDRLQYRWGVVRDMLRGTDGQPHLYFLGDYTVNTLKEFSTYRKKQMYESGVYVIKDEPANPRIHDAMAALEYLSTFVWEQMQMGGAYVYPDAQGDGGSSAYRYAQKLLTQHSRPEEKYVHLGPGAAA